MRFLFLIVLAGSMVGACTTQPEGKTADSDYGAWDTDADEFIDNDEFRNSFSTSPYYEQWNKDDDRSVDRNEFAQGFFQTIDTDNNGILSQAEWQAGQEAYFSGDDMQEYQALTTWDQDGDQQVTPEEFKKVLGQTDYYDEWDEDGDEKLAEAEIADGVFAMWDTDGNGVIEAQEYEDWFDKRQAH